jgi:pyruvate kinase
MILPSHFPHVNWNRTKIVATLGPASANREVIFEMAKAGMDVCRLNASHGDRQSHEQLIGLIRSINEELESPLTILLDLQGPKIRIGKLDQPFPIQPGDIVELCTSITTQEGRRLPMELETLAQDVTAGEMVLVEDGKVVLSVLDTNKKDLVRLTVISGHEIGSRKGVNLPESNISLVSMTEKDLRDVHIAIENKIEWIALSFVRKPEDVLMLRQILDDHQCSARIIAKIEKPEALKNIDAIIDVSDGIMVARGDLGVEIPIEDVPFWQKKIVNKCNLAAKPVIVATQMLESMIENPRPTRAEATDVANAVFDGADALMLSGETATGKHPIETIRTMQRIITKAEEHDIVYHRNYETNPDSPTALSDATCAMACRFADEINAKAIVGMTRSGYNAFQLSKCRPKAHIFIFTDNHPLIETLNLVWGVRTFYYSSFEGTNQSVRDVLGILKVKGLIEAGDIVINTASMPLEARQRTNMIKYTVVE